MFNKTKMDKSMEIAKIIILFLICYFLLPVFSYAAFEEMITTGARSQGMGEAFVAISDDASALLINPAGLTSLGKMQTSFTYSMPYTGLENDSLMNSFISFASPIMSFNAIGIGWNYFGANKYKENVFAFSYAHKLLDALTLAGTLKIMMWDSVVSNFYSEGQAANEDLNGMGISADVGVMYKPTEELSVGLTVTDINQPNIVSTVGAAAGAKDLLPLGIRAGASFSLFDFLVDFDYIYKYYSLEEKTDSTICMGMERNLKDLGVPISLRGGINFPGIVKGTNVSFGGSFNNTEGFMFQIDYAMILSFLESTIFTHRFSFTANFETFEERRLKAEASRQKALEDERARLEEEVRKKIEEEAKVKAEEEERKKREEEETRRIVEEKLRKESGEKMKFQDEERKKLEAEKAEREAEIVQLKLDAAKSRLEAEKMKEEAEKIKLEALKAKGDAELRTEAEKKAREEAEAKVAELKGKLDEMIKEMPKEVSVKQTTRGLAVSLGSSVFFSPGKASLTPTAYPLLDKIIEVVSAYPQNKISIEGHTDSVGKRSANLSLSAERADNVANYFVAKGVARERISVKGYGPDRPIASNATPAGREQNRRVEIIILK